MPRKFANFGIGTLGCDGFPAENRYCRLGHGRSLRGPAHRPSTRRARRPLRPSDRGRGGQRALTRQETRPRPQKSALGGRSGDVGDRSRDRRLRRADGRRRRPRQGGDLGCPGGEEIGGHRQQGPAGASRRRPCSDGREEPGGAEFRSRRRRRHPDREDAARGSGRQFARPHLWNPQRHLQLYPDPHGAGEARLRRLPEGGAAARLCRGRSDVRHRGPRYGAEARHPGQSRLRHQGRSERRLCGGHLVHRIGRPGMGGRARLSREAARGRGAGRTKASSSACIRPWCRKTPRSRR